MLLNQIILPNISNVNEENKEYKYPLKKFLESQPGYDKTTIPHFKNTIKEDVFSPLLSVEPIINKVANKNLINLKCKLPKISESSSSDSDSSESTIPPAPNGGWGWVVVFSSFMIHFINDGVGFAFGVLYVSFLDYFQASKGQTALIVSLYYAIPLLAGPLASILVDTYGCRKMTMLGGLISFLGFFSSIFVRKIEALYVTMGLVTGIGLSIVNVASIVIVAFYFDTRRAFATGLATSGSGIGATVLGASVEFLIQYYGWRGTVLIFSGLFLNIVVFGALMRPVEWPENLAKERRKRKYQAKLDDFQLQLAKTNYPGAIVSLLTGDILNLDESRDRNLDGGSHSNNEDSSPPRSSIVTRKTENEHFQTPPSSMRDFVEDAESDDEKYRAHSTLDIPTYLTKNPLLVNETYETLHKDYNVDNLVQLLPLVTNTKLQLYQGMQSRIGTPSLVGSHNGSIRGSPLVSSERRILNDNSCQLPPLDDNNKDEDNHHLNKKHSVASVPTTDYSKENDVKALFNTDISQQPNTQSPFKRSQSQYANHSSPTSPTSHMKPDTKGQHPTSLSFSNHEPRNHHHHQYHLNHLQQRHFPKSLDPHALWLDHVDKMRKAERYRFLRINRSNITSRGCALNTPKYSIRASSCPDVYTSTLQRADGEASFRELVAELLDTLKSMCDFSMLKDLTYALFFVSNFLLCLCDDIPHLYVVDRAHLLGIEPIRAGLLLSMMGFVNTIGQIIFGYLADRPTLDTIYLYTVATSICGLVCFGYVFLRSYAGLAILSVLYGFMISANYSLTSIILVDLVGLEEFTSSYGLILTAQGIGSLIGPPIGGLVSDLTHSSYDATFYLAGILILLSGLIMLVEPVFKRWKKDKVKRLAISAAKKLERATSTTKNQLEWASSASTIKSPHTSRNIYIGLKEPVVPVYPLIKDYKTNSMLTL